MRIGLIDCDGHNFPSLPLMKLSAWHKKQGDTVEWYEPLFHTIGEPLDIVYCSKVFSFTPDFPYHINCKKLVRGGGLVMQFLWWMVKKFTTNLKMLIYRTK